MGLRPTPAWWPSRCEKGETLGQADPVPDQQKEPVAREHAWYEDSGGDDLRYFFALRGALPAADAWLGATAIVLSSWRTIDLALMACLIAA